MKITINDLDILPASERLIIKPLKEDKELFELSDKICAKIYNKLPYTPIVALGHNFAFELDDDEKFVLDIDFHAKSHQKLYKDCDSMPGKESILRHSILFKNDNSVVLNLSFKETDGKRNLDMNYHYQVGDHREIVEHAITQFYNHYHNAKFICSKLIQKGS